MTINEKTIWSSQQNHPELVVQDCVNEFNFTPEQAERLRFILMNRGVAKWLYARLLFIKLKHEVKEFKKADPANEKIEYIQAKMQNIAKMPRYVIWGRHRHKKMRNNEKEIVVKGRHC